MSLNDFIKFERDFWQTTASAYDKGFGNVTAQTAEFLLDAVKIRSGMQLLDVACGPGYIADEAMKKGAKATGIDFSEAMIDLARKKVPKASFRVADAQKIPFEEGEFNAVTCNFGIMHVPHPEKVFKESFRVCKQGGIFAFVVWNTPETPGAINIIMSSIKEHGTLDVEMPEGPPFFKFSESSVAIRALEDCGFENTQSNTIDIFWKIRSSDELVAAFHNGGARIGGILRAQTPEALKKIKDAIGEKMKAHAKDGIFAVPVSAVLTFGQKP